MADIIQGFQPKPKITATYGDRPGFCFGCEAPKPNIMKLEVGLLPVFVCSRCADEIIDTLEAAKKGTLVPISTI